MICAISGIYKKKYFTFFLRLKFGQNKLLFTADLRGKQICINKNVFLLLSLCGFKHNMYLALSYTELSQTFQDSLYSMRSCFPAFA